MNELETAQCRLWNAQAAALELRTGRSKRELLTIQECFQLLHRLRVSAIEKVSWNEQSILQVHLDGEMEKLTQVVKQIQEQARW